MSNGKTISIVVLLFLACFVLFGVTDPKEVYDGCIKIVQSLADKGEWVTGLWKSIVQGDIKSIWNLIKDSFFDFDGGLVGIIKEFIK